MQKNEYYTQRDWDRVIGWGTVPIKYQYPHLRNTKEYKDSNSANKNTKKLDKTIK